MIELFIGLQIIFDIYLMVRLYIMTVTIDEVRRLNKINNL